MESYITSPVVKSFLAGSFSGTCSTLLFQPLDLVKTRIQVPVGTSGPVGMLSIAGTVVRQDKLFGLWKGLVPSMSRCVPGIGIYFSTIHYLRSNFESADKPLVESILIGATARTVSVLSVIPFTVIKTRYESGKFNYKSMLGAFFDTYKTSGSRGLFSGISPTLFRDVVFSGLYYMFYTEFKKRINECNFSENETAVLHFWSGMMSGIMASMITQPADVIKTHVQLSPKEHRKMLRTIRFIYENNGFKGFFRGVVPRTLRRALMAAMAWTVYEKVSIKLGLK